MNYQSINSFEEPARIIRRAGVPEDRIAVSDVCTMCNTDVFYSYRGRCLENEQVAMLVNTVRSV